MDRNLVILSSIGGWVDQIDFLRDLLKGFAMYSGATV